jgi:hypothetical protein
MSNNKLTKREQEIMKSMKLDFHTTKTISEIGRISGTHKYDVWIGKQISKNPELINNLNDFQFIIDWALKARPDIFSMSFEKAFENSDEWHKNLKPKNSNHILKQKEDDKIIYRTKDNNYFFVLLNPDELDIEGDIMKNCVGAYKEKLKKGHSLIISMRDKKNEPHITIEVDVRTSSVVQVKGKANTNPSEEYLKLITEFAIYASGFEEDFNDDIINLINLKFKD